MNDNLIKLFSFTEKEKKIFVLLADYSEKINLFLKSNKFSDEQNLRYVLIGFFIDYRGCNHRGDNFNTSTENTKLLELKRRKYEILNNLLGKEVESTQEYLSLIKLSSMKNISGTALFDFVVNGKPI